MNLVPIDGNPFGEDELPKNKKLVPVEGNPFAVKADFERHPAEDMSAFDAARVGIWRGLSQVGAGVQQGVYGLGSILGVPGADQKQAELAASQAEADRLYKPLQKAQPLATAIGETMPAFAVPIGSGLSLGKTALRMAIPGILQGGLSYGSLEDRAKDAAAQGVGGALGAGAGALIGKAISPAAGAAARAANPELDRLAKVASDAGIKLTPAQAGGGKFAQGVESALDTIPMTVGGQQAVKEAQYAAFNRKVLSGIGADATKATPDVLADSAVKIGARMDEGTTGVVVPLTDSTRALVGGIRDNYLKRLPEEIRVKVGNVADDLLNAGPSISGEQYKLFSEDIAAAARATTDKKTERALYGLRNVLDEAYKASAPPEKVAAYLEGRAQWKNLLTITDALEKSRSVTGDIPAKQYYAAVQRFNANVPRGGGGEVADVARMGRQFLVDPVNNSGTAFRNAFTNLLSAGAFGGLGGLGSLAAGGDPVKGMELGLLGFGLSKGAQRLYNSPYPANQLLSEEAKRLLARSGGLLGAGAGGAMNQ